MEISVLQSLIDRTSNQIAEYEGCYEFEKNLQKYNHLSDFEMEQSKYAAQYFKSRIPRLVKIQKVLKKEIANELKKAAQQRFYDSM